MVGVLEEGLGSSLRGLVWRNTERQRCPSSSSLSWLFQNKNHEHAGDLRLVVVTSENCPQLEKDQNP